MSEIVIYDGQIVVHSGVAGQTWGVKNGPPYPLDRKKLGLPSLSSLRKKSASGDSDGGSTKKKSTGSGESTKDTVKRKMMYAQAKKKAEKAEEELKKNLPKPKPKQVSEMSDNELRERINRIKLELEYKDYLAKQNPKKENKLKKIIAGALEKAGQQIVSSTMDRLVKELTKTDQPADVFDIKKYKDANVYDMDPDTLKKVKDWYTNAEVLENKRRNLNNVQSKSENKNNTKQEKKAG